MPPPSRPEYLTFRSSQLMPTMGAPRLQLTSASFFGSLKFATASTMAFARLAGSLDLKILTRRKQGRSCSKA